MPKLIFSDSDHLNTDISDEQGHILYTISTPWAFNKVTTITKYQWNGSTGLPQTLGTIKWYSFTGDIIQFDGRTTNAEMMLEKRAWQSGRYFVGPDRKSYKWKLESNHCWLKPADADRELVRFHQQNLGIAKKQHPPYLDVSSKVVHMLDHIVLTFIYVEKLRRDQARRRGSSANSANLATTINMNIMNNTNTMNSMSTMT